MNQEKKITSADFRAFKSDGSLHPDIVKAFLVRSKVSVFDLQDGKLSVSDYKDLILIPDDEVIEALKHQRDVDCIVSVQFRRQGYYAIARLMKRGETHE
jgi:hypothetical protein